MGAFYKIFDPSLDHQIILIYVKKLVKLVQRAVHRISTISIDHISTKNSQARAGEGTSIVCKILVETGYFEAPGMKLGIPAPHAAHDVSAYSILATHEHFSFRL